MNKQLLIGIGTLLLIGGGYFFYQQSAGNLPANQAVSGIIKGNIQDLFARGANLQCTFKYDDENNMTDGTVYLSGKKMRGDFLLTQNDGKIMKSHVIRDDVYGYTWLEGQEQGTKIKIETSEKKEDLFALDDKKINYDCESWNVDSSLFTPPANIKFQDLSAQVEQIKKTTEEFNESKCDTCNQIPAGTTRDQCLQALNCK